MVYDFAHFFFLARSTARLTNAEFPHTAEERTMCNIKLSTFIPFSMAASHRTSSIISKSPVEMAVQHILAKSMTLAFLSYPREAASLEAFCIANINEVILTSSHVSCCCSKDHG